MSEPEQVSTDADELFTNRERIENALAELLDADENGNSFRYFRAADLAEIDPELSGKMVGSYLPTIEEESPVSNGVIVEEYNETNCGPSLWTVRRDQS